MRQKISLDSNRLVRVTQRTISAAWSELSGSNINILPEVAKEVTHGKFIDDLDTSIELAKAAVRITRHRRDHTIAFMAECDLWWLEEMHRDDSAYDLCNMTRDESLHAADIRARLPVKAFRGVIQEDMMAHGDAIIVSEALAKSQNLLITSDDGIDPDQINEWLYREGNKSGIQSDPLVFMQDEMMYTLYKSKPENLLYIVIGASWPYTPSPSNADISEKFHRQLKAMETGALLSKTATLVRRQWNEMVSDKESIFDYVRDKYLPEKMRKSEMRHPSLRARQSIIR